MAKEKRKTVRIEGAFFTFHSLAHVNRELAVALSDRGWRVIVAPIEKEQHWDKTVPHFDTLKKLVGDGDGPDVVLRHAFPPDFSPTEAPTVLMQPWEFFAAPDAWVEAANGLFEELWANSHFSRASYVRSGVRPHKVLSMPLGLDPKVFSPLVHPYKFSDDEDEFRFIYVGGTISRKGADLMLRAYHEEFSPEDPVRLVVKDGGTRHVYRHNNLSAEMKRSAEDVDTPSLTYLDDDMSTKELAGLYIACDCLVQPYRGEGFCLPVIEAMACGLPVIVTGGGSTDDLVLHGTGWKVLSRPAGISQTPGLESSLDQAWLEPDLADLRACMRDAYENREKTKRYGEAAARLAADNWTWEKVAELYDERLRTVASGELHDPLAAKVEKADISLCMIVKDEERVLADCLNSAKPFFREMIVVDTGSSDRTAEIAQSLGAEVRHMEWPDSFAVARNESMRGAKGKWIFWLDADDTLPPECGETILDAAITADDDVLGFVVPVQFVDDGPGGGTRVDHVKLFRNLPGIAFEGRIHEQILGTLRQHEGKIARCDACVLHSGYDNSEEGQKKKRRRDEKLLKLDLEDRPDHPFVLFNLGMTAHYTDGHEEAVDWFDKCLAVSEPNESHVRKTYALKAVSHRELGDPEKAIETLQEGLDTVGHDPELHFHMGLVLSNLERYEQSLEHYQQVGKANPSGYFTSMDVGILGFKLRHNTGSVLIALGRYDEAKAEFMAALEGAPHFMPSAFELFDHALKRKDLAAAQDALEHVRRNDGENKSWAEMTLKYADAVGGEANVEATMAPMAEQNVHARKALASWLVKSGRAEEAARYWDSLQEQGDAESAYFLGVSEVRRGRFQEALRWMRRAQALNPGHDDTEQQIAGLEEALSQEK